ncbi:MAG: lysophospholipid acyltransferase family protein [Candidatus Thiodiazotropha sp. (ex Ctena orbiculata)]|nr:lysophospholipid acyltransferase family protein [Candidatus Thiodiazotropha taylori]
MLQPFEHWDLALKYRLLFPVLSHFPRYIAYRLASLYGKWECARQKEMAEQIAHQMSRAIPGESAAQYRQWTDYFYGLQQREILDTWRYPHLRTVEQVAKTIEVRNFQQVLEARRDGRPMVFAGAHLGRFWMLGVTTAAYGIATGALARDDEERNTWGLAGPEFRYRKLKLSRLRACYRGDFLMPGAANMRPLLEALRRQPFAILLDVPYAKGSAGLVSVPFFGREAFFPEGTIKLAKKTGALIQPFCVEEHRHGLILDFLPAHEAGALPADESMAQLVADIERRIRLNPGRWWQWPALPMFWGEV